MKQSRLMSCMLIVSAVCTFGCERHSTPPPEPVADAVEDPPHVLVSTAKWHCHQVVTGQVVLRRTVTLRAARAGRVADCTRQVGQHVKRGQILLRLTGPRIDSPRRMLEDDLKILREQHDKAQTDMGRFSRLLEKGLINENDKQLVAARATLRERALAITKVQNEIAQLEAAATLIVPVDGQIGELPVRNGSDVERDEPVAVLYVSSDVAIEAAVFPLHGISLHPGLRAHIYLGFSADPIALSVDYLLPRAERRTGAIVVGMFPGAHTGPLHPGQRLRVDLLGDDVPAIVVPRGAVVSRAGKTYCVKRLREHWQAVEVTVLDVDEQGRVYLSDGLSPGDDVMTQGAYGLMYRDFRKLFTFED